MEQLGTQTAARKILKPLPRDRRGAVRQKVHSPAFASLNGSTDDMVLDLSEILDISEAGAAIQTSSSWEISRVVNLCLDLSATKTYLQTTGRVVWADRTGRIGVRFQNLPAASRRKLQEWLFLNAMVGAANYVARHGEPQILRRFPAPEKRVASSGQGAFEEGADYTTTLVALSTVQRQVEVLGPDLEAALGLIAERARAFTRANGAAIALSERRGMVCRASAGDAPPVGATLDASSGFSGYCLRTGFLQRCDDAETDLRVDRGSCRALGIRSIVAVPISEEGTVIGLLEVFSSEAHAFNERDGTVLQRLVDTILAAIDRAARHRFSQSTQAQNSGPLLSLGPAYQASGNSPFADQLEHWDHGESIGLPQRHLVLLVIAALSITLVLGYVLSSWTIEKLHTSKPSEVKAAELDPSPAVELPAPRATVEQLRRQAEKGDPYLQVALATRYAMGDQVPQDYSMAARWFLRAAEQGHVGAQDVLGTYYLVGRGVSKDVTRAYFWSVLARASGKDASKLRVAVMTPQLTRAQALAIEQQANQFRKQHPPLSNSESAF
jgi:putative methionine-R-sulfoxide reductase with GAF domain